MSNTIQNQAIFNFKGYTFRGFQSGKTWQELVDHSKRQDGKPLVLLSWSLQDYKSFYKNKNAKKFDTFICGDKVVCPTSFGLVEMNY